MGSRDMKVFCNDHFTIKNKALSCIKAKSPAKFANQMKKIVSLEEDLRLFDSRPNILSKQTKQNKFIVKKPQIDKFGLGSVSTRRNRP